MTDLLYGEPMTQHPGTEEIAAYLSDGLTPLDRTRVEAHLAECRTCRQEVVSARRLLQSRSVRSRWSMMVPAAAAAVLALAILGRGFLSRPVDRDIVRGAGTASEVESAPSIQVFSPADGSTLAGRAILFAWAGQPGRPLYRLTLTDGSGHALWIRDTADTTIALPASVSLPPTHRYFWYVDALDSDGQSLTTGTRTVSIRP